MVGLFHYNGTATLQIITMDMDLQGHVMVAIAVMQYWKKHGNQSTNRGRQYS
jgi:hypothetical protein